MGTISGRLQLSLSGFWAALIAAVFLPSALPVFPECVLRL
ncbi:hypothetical protein USDA257_c39700 [Sinorhizobium fredii USDA 257]|uniref:Uncharacterized protein n=1 Tax=Sinorhizobium fredii (strain USDA 257) TaxID=1185652 RepID=I3X9F8_SINF2|nr:hypothetical protein USDA257_c39700 [Sinorhizobium fredii USDA 257]